MPAAWCDQAVELEQEWVLGYIETGRAEGARVVTGGGGRSSGIGRRCGIEGLELYTETKTVGWPANR